MWQIISKWLVGFLNPYIWPPARVRFALKNIKNSWSDDPQRSEDSFRIVLCWLKDDSGENGEAVARAFTGVDGIELVRSGRSVTALDAGGNWRSAMQRSALAVMEKWHADLAIVGLVKKSGESLSLWFVPRSGEGTLDRGDQTYRLEDVTLGADFHDDLRSQLTATALVAVAPLANTEVRGQVLEKGLKDAAEKLSSLLEGSHNRRRCTRQRTCDSGRARERTPRCPVHTRDAALGRQPRRRTCDPGRARERHRAPGTGREGLPRRP